MNTHALYSMAGSIIEVVLSYLSIRSLCHSNGRIDVGQCLALGLITSLILIVSS